MAQFKNVIEIFKLLEKNNCRRCNEPTCLAFAASVFSGKKQLSECPRLGDDVILQYKGFNKKPPGLEEDTEERIRELKAKVSALDLSTAAQRLGVIYRDQKLTFKIMGKDFSVDSGGNIFTDIHVNPWIVIPALTYILESSGTPPTGKWLPMRELNGGKDWYRLFNQRCEKPLKQMADNHSIFETLIHIFNGQEVTNHYKSDISLVLQPLPLLPVLICYWKPDEGLKSTLNLFFDSTAEENLNIGSIYSLATGLVTMFEKISLRHGTRR